MKYENKVLDLFIEIDEMLWQQIFQCVWHPTASTVQSQSGPCDTNMKHFILNDIICDIAWCDVYD